MDIVACPQCASLELSLPSAGDGGLSGITATKEAVCDRCGFQGTPLLFAELEDYRAFRDVVARGAEPLEGEGPTEEAHAGDRDAAGTGFDLLEGARADGARGSAVFVGLLGLVPTAFGLWALVATVLGVFGAGARGPDLPNPLGLAFMLVVLGVGLAMLRIAWRMWTQAAKA